MKPEQYTADKLFRLFRVKKIVTMEELKEALGTNVDMTVFRKLQELDYYTSYSHGGRYYTLGKIVDFDESGLWSYRSVWFSRYRTLLSTAQACVESAEAGYFAGELEKMLHVSVKDAVRKLVNEGHIDREKFNGMFLYCSSNSSLRKKQIRARHMYESSSGPLPVGQGVRMIPDELKAAIVLFFSLLDEQLRRLYAGLESLKLGRGGDSKIAELLGLDVGTVACGRRQLLDRDIDMARVRKSGAGRPLLEKKRRK